MGDIAQVVITCRGNTLVVTRGHSSWETLCFSAPKNPAGAALPPKMEVKPQTQLDQSRTGLGPSVCPSPTG